MKISRPTLNKWIDDELQKDAPWSRQQFDLKTVLSELKKQ